MSRTNWYRVLIGCCTAAALLAPPSRSLADCALWDWLFGHGQTTYAPAYVPPTVCAPAAGGCGCAPVPCAPVPARLPTVHAHRHLSHFLSAGAHGGLHAGHRHRSLQRLRGDDLSPQPGLDLPGLATAVFGLPGRLRPRRRGLQSLRQLRRLRPVQRLFDLLRRLRYVRHALRRLLVLRRELWRMLVVRHELRRMLLVRHELWGMSLLRGMLVVRHDVWRMLLLERGCRKRLCHVGRMLLVYGQSAAVFAYAHARCQRHESAAGYLRALARPVAAGDDGPARRGAGSFLGTTPDLRPRRSGSPGRAECDRRRFCRRVLSRPQFQRGEPQRRALEDPEHPARQQRSTTRKRVPRPHAQRAPGERESYDLSTGFAGHVLSASRIAAGSGPGANDLRTAAHGPPARGRQRLGTRRLIGRIRTRP